MGWGDLHVVGANADETAVFGRRDEGGSSFYKIETRSQLAPADAENKVEALPQWQAVASQNNLCLALDHTVHILKHAGAELTTSMDLDAPVDLVAWGGDEEFLVIADRAGSVHLVDTATKNVLFSQVCSCAIFRLIIRSNMKPSADIQKLVAQQPNHSFATLRFRRASDNTDMYEFFVVTTTGQGFIFGNIALGAARAAIDGRQMAQLAELKKTITMRKFEVATPNECLRGAALTMGTGVDEYCITWGDFGIQVWEHDEGAFVLSDQATSFSATGAVLQCELVTVRGQVMALIIDDEHNLTLWHLDSLTVVKAFGIPVESFVLLEPTEEDAGALRLMCATHAEPGKARFIKLLRGDSLQEEYSLAVAEHSLPVESADPECLILLEMRHKDKMDSLGAVQDPSAAVILVRSLEPTQPSNRLYHLLHQQRFAEATQLATQFGLDQKLVHEVRVNHVLNQLDLKPTIELRQELEVSLEAMDDLEFVVTSALNASLPSVHETMLIFQYAEGRLRAAAAEGTAPEHELHELTSRVLCAVKRLGTYNMMTSSSAFDSADWHRFRQTDLLRELTNSLAAHRIDVANTIWTRHESEYDLAASADLILDAMPDALQSKFLIPFLRDEVFPRLQRQHHAFALEWLHTRATMMELTEKNEWPACAIELIETGESIIAANGFSKTNAQHARRLHSWHTAHPSTIVDGLCGRTNAMDGAQAEQAGPSVQLLASQLLHIKLALEDLRFLQDVSGFRLALGDYQTETPESILFALLERVAAADLIPEVLLNQVRPYAARHNLDLDAVLLRYIKALASGAQTVAVTGSNWCSRALAIIGCLGTTEIKATATMVLMGAVSVPCPADVDALIEEARAWPHAQKSEFDEQYRILALRKMLLPYGISNFNISNTTLARRLVRHIACNLEQPTALQDAMQVVEAYSHIGHHDVYVHRIRHLATHGRAAEAQALFTSLSGHLLASVGLELLQWADLAGSDTGDALCLPALRMGIYLADYLIRAARVEGSLTGLSSNDVDSIKRLHQRFHAACVLKDEYHVDVDFQHLGSYGAKQDCLAAVVAARVASKPRGTNSYRHVLRDVRRVAGLLDLEAPALLGHLTDICVRGDLPFSVLITYCHDSCRGRPTSELATALAECVENLIRYLANRRYDRALDISFQDILDIARLSLAYSAPEHCLDRVAFYRIVELAALIEAQCDISTAGGVQQLPTHLALLARQFRGQRFIEDGLVLSGAEVMPLVCKYITAVYPSSLRDPYKFQCRRVACRTAVYGEEALLSKVSQSAPAIFNLLARNRQLQLGLRAAIDALVVCAEHRYLNDDRQVIQDRFEHLVPRAGQVVSSMLQELLSNVLMTACPDRTAALGYMMALPLDQSFQVFSTAVGQSKRQFTRLEQLAWIGTGLALLWSEEDLLSECRSIAKTAKWGCRLGAFGIGFDSNLLDAGDQEEIHRILLQLLTASHNDLAIVIEWAEAYGLTKTVACNTFVETMCISTDPSVICLNADGFPDVQPALKEQIKQLVVSTRDPEGLACALRENVLPRISNYHYERIQFVLDLLAIADGAAPAARYTAVVNTGTLLLGVLRLYKRRAAPSKVEVKDIEALPAAERVLIEAAARTRLPFHILTNDDPWICLLAELDLKSINRLMSIARLLSLSRTEVYACVIDKMLPELATCVDSETVDAVLALVPKLEDPQEVIIKYHTIADELPLGAAKLEALRLATAAAAELACVETQVQAHAERLAQQYQSACAQVKLQTAGILDSSLCELLSQPDVFVRELLQEYCIGSKAAQLAQRKVNLLHLAEGVAAELGVDAEALRNDLISQWLMEGEATVHGTNMTSQSVMATRAAPKKLSLASVWREEPAAPTRNSSAGAVPLSDDLSLQKAVALLRLMDVHEAVSCLLSFAQEEHSNNISPATRVRAYMALFMVANPHEIVEISDSSMEQLREDMLNMIYTARLTALGIMQTSSDFIRADKEGLIRSIWKNYAHDDQAIVLVADLCLQYELYDAALWDAILRQMLQLRLYSDLQRLLAAASGIPELWCLPCLETAWRDVIRSCVSRASAGGAQSNVLIDQALELVSQSPFVLRTDVSSLAQMYEQRERHYDALVAISLTNDGETPEYAEQLSQTQLRAVLDETRLRTAPLMGKVQACIFDLVDRRQAYQLVLGTPDFTELVQYLIQEDRVDNLLLKTVLAKRWADAVRLVRAYASVHQLGLDLDSAADEPSAVVRAFAEARGLAAVVAACA
ncbi:uncharacterized protein MONBRDRAFT_24036 [Monosiga brevicollis MX1]|uniref:RZZ complex subunit KNTC1/ROD C-terminal domain-containing protein n=1 Tax=Monosiga brevicollis TaxID=81824 RepID=A9UUI3_MONBE|nr:uncharacterized protein MONBRDRAFT_24036 [Monosiga brevicollis MX1]EDQ91102.1 predicted protein [Monosiga brevicollis MX1]|eukprot:XP_001744399.1 hypothetical protein [Monosiga brevicollis MX1]